ncbi:MAG: hypothetical protein M1338_03350 [Patescibacteria group bacterium]|nr:hypothetical protein [Patescibacteria group bacterium]
MQNTKYISIFGIILVLAVAGGLYYWFGQIAPDAAQVDQKAAEVKMVDKNILANPNAKKITERQIYGNVPLNVTESETGKSNPFE